MAHPVPPVYVDLPAVPIGPAAASRSVAAPHW
jgi:hypothetical protein